MQMSSEKAKVSRATPAGSVSRRTLLGATTAGALGVVLTRAGEVLAQPATPSTDTAAPVAVYPAHGTWTASPETEISFRGITVDEIGPVHVNGSISGGHSGILAAHADGHGVSYLPDARFEPGELVTVRAPGLPGGASSQHRFGVSRPVAWAPAPAERVVDNPDVAPRAFRSRPDLRPPVMTVTDATSDATPGKVILAAKVARGQNGVMILDEAGELVWYSPPLVDTYIQNNARVQEYRGQPVLTWSEAATPIGFGLGHYVICDAGYRRIAELQVGNGFSGGDLHEFVLTRRSTALVILYHAIEWDMSPLGGARFGSAIDCVIQELEVETGRVLFEWHTLDHIDLDETRIVYNPPDNRDHPYDYFHMNSIEEDADGNLIISARHTFAIYKIDRRSGEIAWRLHGERSDFEMEEGTEFRWQHDARVHADGTLSLFDNHESRQDMGDTTWSRGLVLQLDEVAMTATLVREYIHPTEILSVSQGNMQILPNGNVFIGWGSAPVFTEFTPDGEVVFNGRFPRGGTSYRAYRSAWVGMPEAPPDVAVEQGEDGGTTVYASWNGATEVVSWRVLAGSAQDALAEVATADRTGFETMIEIDAPADYVAVEALDAVGEALGRSDVVQHDRG